MTRHKHLRLAALRVLRAIVAKNDDFYNRFLMKSDLFRPALDMMWTERKKDNLLASACLELFEYVRTVSVDRTQVVFLEKVDADITHSLCLPLLCSACVRALNACARTNQTNPRAIINYLMDRHNARVRQLAATPLRTFELVIAKWAQNNEPPPPAPSTSSTLGPSAMSAGDAGAGPGGSVMRRSASASGGPISK